MSALSKNGWGGRSRTPTYGTRNRCPTIRRHPIDFSMMQPFSELQARMVILRNLSPFVKYIELDFTFSQIQRFSASASVRLPSRILQVWNAAVSSGAP